MSAAAARSAAVVPATEPARTGDAGASPDPAGGVIEELANAATAARVAVASFIELLVLEARRAGLAVIWMLVCAAVGAICIVAAWTGLMAGLALLAISLGSPPTTTVVAIALVNLLVGAGLLGACVGLSRRLLFPATRRQIAGRAAGGSPVAS